MDFYFWSTTFLQPEKRWIYGIKPPFFSDQQLFSNQISQTTFYEPLFYTFPEKWLQIKWSYGDSEVNFEFRDTLGFRGHYNSGNQRLEGLEWLQRPMGLQGISERIQGPLEFWDEWGLRDPLAFRDPQRFRGPRG